MILFYKINKTFSNSCVNLNVFLACDCSNINTGSMGRRNALLLRYEVFGLPSRMGRDISKKIPLEICSMRIALLENLM